MEAVAAIAAKDFAAKNAAASRLGPGVYGGCPDGHVNADVHVSADGCAGADRAATLGVASSTLELEAQITELAGHLNAGNHRLLALIAEFDRRSGWASAGAQSCAHWLNWKCGIDLGAAREKVRVANALQTVPRISAAMARGELSYSKVRALTRVATAATEELLLSIALHGTAQHVETTVRCFRRAQQAEELSREARQQAARRLSYFYDDDGSLVFKGSLPAEVGALFLKAIDAAVEAADRHRPAAARTPSHVSAEASVDAADRHRSAAARTPSHVSAETSVDAADRHRSATPGMLSNVSAETSSPRSPADDTPTPAEENPTPGERPSLSVRRADGLARIAESFLAHGAEVSNGGDRHQIVVHVDAQTLREGCAGRCEHEDGPALPVETARRLGCDASVVSIIEGENGEPLNVGRRTRTIPPSLRRALNSRDRGCRFPGCSNKHYVDGHHIRHWADGGETRLSNLATLCRFHHRQVHEGGIDIQVLNDGALRFTMKDGRSLESLRPSRPGDAPGPIAPGSTPLGPVSPDVLQGAWPDLFAAHDALDIVIDRTTAVTRWTGESMDYGTATDALIYRARRASAASPPTK